jgi:hypothetical protein
MIRHRWRLRQVTITPLVQEGGIDPRAATRPTHQKEVFDAKLIASTLDPI